jgi:hypothetical protein
MEDEVNFVLNSEIVQIVSNMIGRWSSMMSAYTDIK